ncbi:hypothetical protein FRC01_006453, partial [Tulasnella sp. 417]
EFAKSPTVEDWQRFEYYSRRIRRMRLGCLPASTDFWSALASAVLNRATHPTVQIDESPVLPIFPKLKSLECDLREDNFEVCVLVINESPALDSFALFADPGSAYEVELPSQPWVAVFSSLGNHGRPLKTLAIRPIMYDTEARDVMDAKADSLVQLIGRSPLQELILPRDAIMTEIIASAISYLPTLKVLEVSDDWTIPDDYEAASVPHNAFSSLERLSGDIIPVKSLLTIPTFPSLAKLMIEDRDEEAHIAWFFVRDMIKAIGQNCPALEVLHVCVRPFFDEPGDSERARRATTSVFTTLQGCPRLKDVLFDFSKTWFSDASSAEEDVNMSDAQWEQLAEAWPDLTSVRFWMGRPDEDCGWFEFAPRPIATLRTISSFFRHCPKLFSFSVPIFARGGEARTALVEVSPKQGPTQLDFRGSWIDTEDVQGVAIFLASQSPHQETEIRIHLPEEPYVPNLLVLQGRAIDVAQYEGWQEMKQLVESARTTDKPGGHD